MHIIMQELLNMNIYLVLVAEYTMNNKNTSLCYYIALCCIVIQSLPLIILEIKLHVFKSVPYVVTVFLWISCDVYIFQTLQDRANLLV